MKRIFLLSAIILLVIVTIYISSVSQPYPKKIVEVTKEATATAEVKTETTARVTYVIDGDTIEIEGGQRVRYIGVNSPELGYDRKPDECFAKEAREENGRIVLGRIIRLVRDVSDTDKYGRLLRYVYVGNNFINDELVKNGFAKAEPVPPDTQMAGELYSSQSKAKAGIRGLWSKCPTL